MSVRVESPRILWTRGSLPDSALDRLRRALERWRGTPYESGQRFVQRGADCIGAVFGVIDEVDGRPRALYPQIPHDSAMHSRAGAFIAMRALLGVYSPSGRVEPEADGSILAEPGDIVVTGPHGGGPGHVEIVGTRKNELWHAVGGSGFHQGGWSLFDCQQLVAVFRLGDRDRWS